MALPTPPPYSNPIPNNPFYSPLEFYVQGPYSTLVMGSGLFIDYNAGTINSSGGGGGVNSIVAGSGIGVSGATGNVTISNTGVLSLTAGAGINISGSTGNIILTATSLGTVTLVNTGPGLTGGPITSTGSISLVASGVTPGTYSNANVTVDTYGRVTTVSSGTAVTSVTGTLPISVTAGTAPVISIASASTTALGSVQLSDSVTSISSSLAATSFAVKTAFDAASAAIPKSCVTGKGALVTGTSASVPVALPVGADNLVLTACSTSPTGLCWAGGGVNGTFTFGTCTVVITNGMITSVS
jgi:hypothetical protein